jgi:hypothetical protein
MSPHDTTLRGEEPARPQTRAATRGTNPRGTSLRGTSLRGTNPRGTNPRGEDPARPRNRATTSPRDHGAAPARHEPAPNGVRAAA